MDYPRRDKRTRRPIISDRKPSESRSGMRSKKAGPSSLRKVPKLNQDRQAKPPIRPGTDRNQLPKGLRIDTTTGIGANITKMKTGGVCKGAGAAIKGTKFEGVF
tara:strand:+ start:316 stop:627 length:312 start_codon:yes stop_codon:yes gene_type:complete